MKLSDAEEEVVIVRTRDQRTDSNPSRRDEKIDLVIDLGRKGEKKGERIDGDRGMRDEKKGEREEVVVDQKTNRSPFPV